MNLTDTGNAERFIAKFGGVVRYCAEAGAWFIWNGRSWERDNKEKVQHLAKQTVRAIYGEAKNAQDADARKLIAAWARKSESRTARAAMVTLAQSEPKIAVALDEFDRDPDVLNLENGTLDTKTGELRQHRREDLISKIARVSHVRDARCPIFDAFLAFAIPDLEVRTFAQRVAGYCLTGDVTERIFVFFYGRGKNGKSVFLRIQRHLLGDYAIVAAPDLLIERKQSTHPTELADLRGARLVVCQEVAKGSRFNEQRIKELTGNEGAIKARRMNENFSAFVPTFKLCIAANHKPRILDDSDSIWDRLREVPFVVRVPDDKIDKRLFERLVEKELPGILNWAVAGCLDWREHGLPVPKKVADAGEEYRSAEDTIGRWLADCCVLHADERATTKQLLDSFKTWAEAGGDRVVTAKELGERLRATGCSERRTNKARGWVGIRLLEPAENKAREEARDSVTGSDVGSDLADILKTSHESIVTSTSPAVTSHAGHS